MNQHPHSNIAATSAARVPGTVLVGAGVVGTDIIQTHLSANLSITIADQTNEAIERGIDRLVFDRSIWQMVRQPETLAGLPCVHLLHRDDPPTTSNHRILIESVPERLDIKQAFFARVEPRLDSEIVLCTNTSTLPIGRISERLDRRDRFCGMHFFMPVADRLGVELVRGEATGDETVAFARKHIARLGKHPIIVKDRPGFVVNRLLSVYLNESLILLCRSITADAIESAAKDYGMPISPLELIDTIGSRTMFDAGRSYWQAYPKRLDPSPLLPALIKSGRGGKATRSGLYDYDDRGIRSADLSATTIELIDRYQGDPLNLTNEQLIDRLAIPMWVEAANALLDRSVDDPERFNEAMVGGLGFQSTGTWLEFFDQLGSARILSAIAAWEPQSKAICAPRTLTDRLESLTPSETLRWLSRSAGNTDG